VQSLDSSELKKAYEINFGKADVLDDPDNLINSDNSNSYQKQTISNFLDLDKNPEIDCYKNLFCNDDCQDIYASKSEPLSKVSIALM
jgi:hypothetical protein